MDGALEDPRLTAVGLLIEVHDGLTARLSKVHASYGLLSTDFDTIIRLARSPEGRLRMGDLAAQVALSTSGVTRIVDRLEREGLARREPSPGDRRGWSVVLTAAGMERVRKLLPDLLAVIDEYFTGRLTPTQLDTLLDTLHLVRGAVRPGAASGAAG